ncbi:MAG: dephospho-CoA kinase [Oligoflexia bacterium]|nr:dephospho-CoA kinase [Oligoflexia bacterium]
MKWIGITGGIATGKSTVSKMLQDLGEVVIDADLLAKEVVQPESFGLNAVVTYFGPEVLKKSGELDRKKMAEIVFKDPTQRTLLENILHPLIQWRSLQEREVLQHSGKVKAFYDAALIYEKNLQSRFDAIIVVVANQDVQKKRLMERNKLTPVQAQKIIESQWPLLKKAEQAKYVIDNNGTINETKKQLVSILKEI